MADHGRRQTVYGKRQWATEDDESRPTANDIDDGFSDYAEEARMTTVMINDERQHMTKEYDGRRWMADDERQRLTNDDGR